MSKKDTNPKDAVGTKKRPSSTVSQAVMAEVGAGMLEGARKYGRHNYRVSGVRASVYYDATRRHVDDWWEGEDIDPDSGLSHITKAICSLCVLRDAMIQDTVVDDRPPKTPSWHKKYLQRLVEEVFKRYPKALDAYTNAEQESGSDDWTHEGCDGQHAKGTNRRDDGKCKQFCGADECAVKESP